MPSASGRRHAEGRDRLRLREWPPRWQRRAAGPIVVGGAALLMATAVAIAEPPTPARPNVVLILADDLGYGDLGCYGATNYRTPELDRLASQGARFTQFNTPAPFCAPTRTALLTGRYPLRAGLPVNPTPDGRPVADRLHLPTSERLLPELLRQAGYATGMIGKWHLGHAEPAWRPPARGFDDYLGILYSNDMRPVRLWRQNEVVEYPVVQATLTRRYTDEALAFIERHRERPFFLYLAHAMPHKPLAASEDFFRQSGAGLYGDVLSELDHSVGRVLAQLETSGIAERTLVIFTSDNGPWFGGSTGGLRGMKGTPWEGGLRVPCLVRWPESIPAGTRVDALAATMDLFATVLSATGVAPPNDRTSDGVDLLPVMRGERPAARNVLLGQQGGQPATIRDQDWKLFVGRPPPTREAPHGRRPADPRVPDGVTILAPWEQASPEAYPGVRTGDEPAGPALFQLTADPSEQRDVAAEHPQIVARLRGEFERILAECRAEAGHRAEADHRSEPERSGAP